MIRAYIVLGILSVWLLATVACQVSPALRRRLSWWNFFLRLPKWTLFVTPVSNYGLLYRDRLADGSDGAWKSVRLSAPHAWYNVLWNPQLWEIAAVWKLVRELKLLRQAEQPPAVRSSAPYHLILRYVTGLPRPPDSTARQFMIIEGAGQMLPPPPRVLFASEFHEW